MDNLSSKINWLDESMDRKKVKRTIFSEEQQRKCYRSRKTYYFESDHQVHHAKVPPYPIPPGREHEQVQSFFGSPSYSWVIGHQTYGAMLVIG